MSTELFDAVKNGEIEKVILLIKAGADVNARDEYGSTPLMFAGIPTIANLLIEAGANLDERNNCGETALLFLGKDGNINNIETIEILLKAGANKNISDDNTNTLLSILNKNLKSEDHDYEDNRDIMEIVMKTRKTKKITQS